MTAATLRGGAPRRGPPHVVTRPPGGEPATPVVWNELLIALLFLQNENSRTLMAGLTQFQGRFSTNEPLILSGALLSILPVVVLYLSGQRFFVRGLTAGIGK